jgi:integrase
VPRPSTGQVVERQTSQGRRFAIRFRALGERRYQTLDVSTRAEAEAELANVLADVRRGLWKPPVEQVVTIPKDVPSFHAYASEWHARRKGLVKPRTSDWEKWALSLHLLPHLAERRVSDIDGGTVRAYVAAKQAEGIIGARSINSTLRVLSLICAEAVEDGHLQANPVTRARLVKARKPTRGWLEPDELADLLDSCTSQSRALVAAMALAGLRVSEAAALRWRCVDLANGRLTVEASKTDAGRRVIGDLNPELGELLKVHRHASRFTDPDDVVFATSTGREKARSSIARQILRPALDRANVARTKAARPPIARASCHDLRRTFCALAFAAGASPAAVMNALGHTSAALSLEVYGKVVAGATDGLGVARGRLVRGPDWAPMGTSGVDEQIGDEAASDAVFQEVAT